MERGGGGKYGDGENMGMIIPSPNARTYTATMTEVWRLSLSSSDNARAYPCVIHATARIRRRGGDPESLDLLNELTDLSGGGNIEEEGGEEGGDPMRTMAEGRAGVLAETLED